MLVLGIETATLVAGVALINNEKVFSEHFINNRKTHSQNLMPMIKEVLTEGGISPQELGGIAVSVGPGSFTGLRIGMATAKALAQALNLPIVGVPTLDALANNLIGVHGLVCPILDAKKSQVYTAIYNTEQGYVEPLSEHMAIDLEELVDRVKSFKQKVTFLGDGVPVFKNSLRELLGDNIAFANEVNALPRGASVAQLGLRLLEQNQGVNLLELQPFYIRRSEAEISWEKRNKNVD